MWAILQYQGLGWKRGGLSRWLRWRVLDVADELLKDEENY